MKITIDGEQVRFEAFIDFTRYGRRKNAGWKETWLRKDTWVGPDRWSLHRRFNRQPASQFIAPRHHTIDADMDMVTPVGYLMTGVNYWVNDESETPKYSRPRQLLITFEHGHVQGYHE